MDEKERVLPTATKSGNLYHLNCASQKAVPAAMKYASSEDTKEHVWHRRYGHLGVNNLERLARDQLVDGFYYDTLKKPSFCEPCVDGKHHFPKQMEKDEKNYLDWCTVTCVVRSKQNHLVEPNTFSHSLMTSQGLSGYMFLSIKVKSSRSLQSGKPWQKNPVE